MKSAAHLKIVEAILLMVVFASSFVGCSNENRTSVQSIELQGKRFRDLNKNGVLDRYEDWRLPVDNRIEDLVSRMTLDEKVGLMFPIILDIGEDGKTVEEVRLGNHVQTSDAILKRKINHVYIYSPAGPKTIAKWSNNIQELAEQTRLGLFNNPYVSIIEADKICGNEKFRATADSAQRKSIVLLKNKLKTLPLTDKSKIFSLFKFGFGLSY